MTILSEAMSVEGEELARTIASADVSIFPSRTDTLGLVMIETLASGVPVAAYDVPGLRDIITSKVVGDDLRTPITQALSCKAEQCRSFTFSRERTAEQFELYLVPLDPDQHDRWLCLPQARHVACAPMLAKPK